MTARDRVTLLHVATVPGSLWVFLRGQVAFMRRQGLSVHAAAAPGPYLQRFGDAEGVTVHAVPMNRRINPLQDAVSILRMTRLLRRIRPDIVHAHTPKGGLVAMLAARLNRVPARIYHIHGLPFATATGRRRRILRLTELISCRCAHRVLCVSASIREVAIAEGLCPAEKIVVPGPGSISGVDAEGRFDPSRYDPVRRAEIRGELGLGATDVVIGFVGRLVRDKGIVELASAWRDLSAETAALRLLLIGFVEAEDPVPDEVLNALRADDRVVLLPYSDEIASLYAAMDVVALPSYREGFPLVPLEAAAMALPVVATRVPGCVDAVVDGTTGTLFPPRDVDALGAALRAYIDDPTLRDAHGGAGRRRVLAEFRPETVMTAIYQQYRELVPGLPGAAS